MTVQWNHTSHTLQPQPQPAAGGRKNVWCSGTTPPTPSNPNRNPPQASMQYTVRLGEWMALRGMVAPGAGPEGWAPVEEMLSSWWVGAAPLLWGLCGALWLLCSVAALWLRGRNRALKDQ